MKKKNIRLIINTIIFIILLIFYVCYDPKEVINNVTFSACVDGDTAKLITSKGIETVRFLAIDTPETVHPTKPIEPYGKEASEYTCNSLKSAKEIKIELDPNSDEYDKYDRLLAWIFVDEKLLQEELINLGYGKVAYLYGDYKYTLRLQKDEAIAKSKNIGIWYNNK